ncbi:hypothetical protein [Nocardioides luteus]|uniref:hypothetical protein n=1 Tax=Nocardioides luteus TaxID=1844 RepID=UPI0018CBE5BF|nr:hypothetical protein [Nocardioides luteus]MBG6098788.1 hypothetical protein [Nocardioides luteus]
MRNEKMNLPPTDTGYIMALLVFGLVGSGFGVGLMNYSDSTGSIVVGALFVGICGVALSVGTIAAGVAVGIGVLPGKTSPQPSARAPKISDGA